MDQTSRRQPDDTPTRVVELVANLDDITGEQAGDIIDRLMQHGALDAWASPITMKKGRPALSLSVLVDQSQRDAFAVLILQLTGSFGVRFRPWDRLVLDRHWHDVQTKLGPVTLKVGSRQGVILAVKPEFDTVRALADRAGITLAQAHRTAQAAADQWLEQQQDEHPQGAADHA